MTEEESKTYLSEENIQNFEDEVLNMCIQNPTFFISISDKVCNQDQYGRNFDFSSPNFNTIFGALRKKPENAKFSTWIDMYGKQKLSDGAWNTEQFQNILSNVKYFEKVLPSISVAELEGIIPFWIYKVRSEKVIAEGSAGLSTPEVVHEKLEFLNSLLTSSKSNVQFTFGMDYVPTEGTANILFQSPWASLDRLTGGCLAGDMTLYAAQSGAGKTAVACQWDVAALSLGRKVIHFFTEQTVIDLYARIFSHRFKINIERIKGGLILSDENLRNTFKEFSEEKIRRMIEFRDEIKDRIRFVGYRTGEPRYIMKHYRDDVKRITEELGGVDLVVFDWPRNAIEETDVLQGKGKAELEGSFQLIANEANRHRYHALVFHQLNETQSKNIRVIDQTMLEASKKLAFFATTALGCSKITFGEKTEEGQDAIRKEQTISIFKSRKGINTCFNVIRRMEYQTLEESCLK